MKWLFLLLLLLAACSRPECTNTDAVFDKYPAESIEYRTELLTQMQKADLNKLSYWIDDVMLINNKRYLQVHIQADNLCAMALLEMGNWKKELTPGNMQGYAGAELKGLKYKVLNDTGGPWLKLVNVDHIVD